MCEKRLYQQTLLSFYLAQCKSFVEWTTNKINIDPNDIISSIRLFTDPFSSFPKIDMSCAPIAVFCKIEAILLLLIGKLFEKQQIEKEIALDSGFLKVKSALDFINQHFREKISLQDIAESSCLTPNYFHQLFKKTFGFTPLDYLTKKNLISPTIF